MAKATRIEWKEGVLSTGAWTREQLRHQTGEASLEHAGGEAAKDRDRPPEPGDLFVLTETAEHAVEWAILDRDPAAPQRLLAVPADVCSLAGSADVTVADDAPRGALTLRCAFPLWIDARAFDSNLRTGVLEPADLEHARRKRDDLERGVLTGSVLQREVDGEAEYQEWLEVLERARAAAPGEPAKPRAEAETDEPGRVVPLHRPKAWGAIALAAAASLIMALALGYGLGFIKPAGSDDGERLALIDRLQDQLARLELERQQLETSLRQDLARLEDEGQRAVLEYQQQIARLEAEIESAKLPKALTNLPLVILAAGRRADEHEIAVAQAASHLMLILQVDDPEIYSEYLLDIRDQATGRQVWSDRELEPSRLSELTALLPRGLMPNGRYELRLSGLRGEQSVPVMETILTLKSP